MFTTRIAIVVRDDLAVWQKLNVTAFLSSGIAAAVPECIGAPYRDSAGRSYTAMIGQPILVFAAAQADLQRVHRRACEAGLTVAPYVEAMFATGHDAANRAVFAETGIESQLWAGLALHGERKAVDRTVKGLKLHP
ncbi:MAG TPA: DUF2000 family protein [Ferrovibrio sp.]|uniref:DUF2000 family protein n=1 Tax=Ferrovibrio sp. TaxID=1917215 RepID=UPI002B4B5F4D|nr:DUF2000 family protein [Ferrovibrio sp.]HLT76320.1 DUF2000 family protein [Ferrovibrio sp.]